MKYITKARLSKMGMRLSVGAFVLLAITFSPASGQVGLKATTVLQTQTTLMGQPIEFPHVRSEYMAILAEIAPGGQSGIHLHPVPLVVYVLEGTLTVEFANEPPRAFRAGEAFAEAVNTLHNGVNRGTTPVRFLIVFAGKEKDPPLVRPAGSTPVGFKTSMVLQTSKTIMGEPILFPLFRNQFTVLVLEIAPGGRVGRHQHPVPPLAYVLDGTVSLEIEGQMPKVFTAGQAWTDSTNMWHDAVTRGSTPARILVVFAGSEGTPVTIRP